MNHKNGLILGCILGFSSRIDTDWNQWQLPILLWYCAAKDPAPDRLVRSEKMVHLELAGFVPLALVTRDADYQAGLGILVGQDTPVAIQQFLIQQAQQIFDKALGCEKQRGSA